MDITARKKKLASAETYLAAHNRQLKRTMTSVRFWERRVKMHQKALQQEMEAELELRIADTGESSSAKRRFRN